MKLKDACSLEESYDQPRQHIKKQRYYFASKGLSSQSYGFSSSHVCIINKAEHQRIDAFELWCWRRLLRVPWIVRRSNQSILRNQSWIFSGRTDAEAETPILWPPDVKNWLIGKDPGAGRDWRWEEKGTTEDEMVGWHHRHGGHGFEEALGAGDGQGSLACCGSWDQSWTRLSDWTELSWPLRALFSHPGELGQPPLLLYRYPSLDHSQDR